MFIVRVVAVVVLAIIGWAAATASAEDKPCVVTAGDGSVYDLSGLTKTDGSDWTVDSNPASGGTSGSRFYLNVCHDILYRENGVNNRGIGAFQQELANKNNAWSIGNTNTKVVVREKGQLLMHMTDGTACSTAGQRKQTVVHFRCDPHASKGSPMYLFDDGCTYMFTWPTASACAGAAGGSGGSPSSSGGMSGWGIFFLLLFIGFGVYMIGGALYRRSRGYTGVDQIPNYAFWQNVFTQLGNLRDAIYARLPSGRREQHHVMLVDEGDLSEPETV